MDDMDDDPGAKENQEIYSCCTLVGRRIPLHMDPPSILCVGYIQVLRPRPPHPASVIKIHQHKANGNGQRYFTLNIILRPVSARRLLPPMLATEPTLDIGNGGDGPSGGDVFSYLSLMNLTVSLSFLQS